MNTTDKIMALADDVIDRAWNDGMRRKDKFMGERTLAARQDLRAEIEALVRERDEADRRAGAAERRLGNCMNDVRRFEIERSQMKTQEKQS